MRIGGPCKILDRVEAIEDLLKDKRFGLAEIKDEVRDIEEIVEGLLPPKGPLSTGPFIVDDGCENAIVVAVQNVGKGCVDVTVRLFDIGCCPPREVDCKQLKDIGRCCAETAVLCAREGIFEVVCCPKPDKAAIRAFVTVHDGPSTNSDVAFRVLPTDFLPVVCPFCKREKDRCRRDECDC